MADPRKDKKGKVRRTEGLDLASKSIKWSEIHNNRASRLFNISLYVFIIVTGSNNYAYSKTRRVASFETILQWAKGRRLIVYIDVSIPWERGTQHCCIRGPVREMSGNQKISVYIH